MTSQRLAQSLWGLAAVVVIGLNVFTINCGFPPTEIGIQKNVPTNTSTLTASDQVVAVLDIVANNSVVITTSSLSYCASFGSHEVATSSAITCTARSKSQGATTANPPAAGQCTVKEASAEEATLGRNFSIQLAAFDEIRLYTKVDFTQLTAAIEAADRMGVRGYEVIQNGYSLLAPDDDRDVRAVCRERGIVYTAFSPLAGGALTGKYRRGEPPPRPHSTPETPVSAFAGVPPTR